MKLFDRRVGILMPVVRMLMVVEENAWTLELCAAVQMFDLVGRHSMMSSILRVACRQ